MSQVNCLVPIALFVSTVSNQGVTHVDKDHCFDFAKDFIHKASLLLVEERCKLVVAWAEAAENIEAVREPRN